MRVTYFCMALGCRLVTNCVRSKSLMHTTIKPQLIGQTSSCVCFRKLPLAERTKAEGSLNYASVFPNWVTHHTIFSSVDSVIRCARRTMLHTGQKR
jgi:hypothetical protein